MAARTAVKRVVTAPARRFRRVVRQGFVPEVERLDALVTELTADRDRLFKELALAFESVTAAHKGIADLQVEQKALRDRLDATLLLAESFIPRIEALDDGLLEARRQSLRIAELTDVVTEVVLPLHDRDIDPSAVAKLRPDTF
ncbi:DUF6752 domain-containing protein [Blastococcus sp. SYSU D00813]